VNNAVYRSLGERWYEAQDDPLALLRAQARLHLPWIAAEAEARLGGRRRRVLDLGCGGGFVANDLARRGFTVVGVDLAPEALEVGARHDDTKSVRWVVADARSLPFDTGSFDLVTAMDFLEHVDSVDDVVGEAARVLSPGGLFFFHTFDRSWASWLVVIKGVEAVVRNVPPRLHVHRAFIRPAELRAVCARHGLRLDDLRGCRPELSLALLRLVGTGVVPLDLAFRFCRSTLTGYSGIAERSGVEPGKDDTAEEGERCGPDE
jgi:2-polyprenyl-6-hydroxyphenyl methylase/3-demethylubiquinone-9 3-methyltransferase